MNKDFFESQEFQDKLASYELADTLGQRCYFDTEDFVDISDYYLDNNRPDDAMRAINQGLLIHKDNNHLLAIKAGIFIYKHQFTDALDIISQIQDYPNSGIALGVAYSGNSISPAFSIFLKWFHTVFVHLSTFSQISRILGGYTCL